MAKKQTRRSISVSRATYDRLKAFCETNGISMSQFVENRVGDVLSHDAPAPSAPRMTMTMTTTNAVPAAPSAPAVAVAPVAMVAPRPVAEAPAPRAPTAQPFTSAAARIAVEPPPPVIKPKSEQPAPKPVEKRPDQIFTF
jgi:hypothetical protein